MKYKGLTIFFFLTCAVFFFGNFKFKDSCPHPYELQYPEAFGKPYIPENNRLTEEGIWLGRLLFYDSILSINKKMSCASCHQQGLSFTDGRPLAIGVFGDTLTRNSMALLNLAWGNSFFIPAMAWSTFSRLREFK